MTVCFIIFRISEVPDGLWAVNAWWLALYGAGAYGREQWRDRARIGGIVASAVEGRPHVLILTTFERDEYIFEALRSGAGGFLLKNAPPEDLIDAVRIVARGDALLAPSVTRRIIAEFARRPAPVPCTLDLTHLTEREIEVLRLVARGLSNAEIADALYVGEATIKTHVSNVLTKLNLRDRVQAVVLAYESGLILPGVS
jgi:DNA-binding NarL/FixJ family response regulator